MNNLNYKADIICDTQNQHGRRLTTFVLRYPRFIHSELMTHRLFSRNASSSRAIPVKRMIEAIQNHPAGPIEWGKNKPGMQAEELLDERSVERAINVWEDAAQSACCFALKLHNLGIHKQIVNRLLEPFQWISVVLTSSCFDNFFELRDHPDAQPEIKKLAQMMKGSLDNSYPLVLDNGRWHIPFIADVDFDLTNSEQLFKALAVSTARCARVSYQTFDGKPSTIEADLKLYNMLVNSQPLHASPAEHQAMAATDHSSKFGLLSSLSGNFNNTFIQHRKIIENFSAGQNGLNKFLSIYSDS